jgi:hypothetical protein
MPIDKRRESRLIAVIYADVSGAGAAEVGGRLRPALARLNHLFAPAVAEPFAVTGAGRVDGALADPAQAPRKSAAACDPRSRASTISSRRPLPNRSP